MTTSFPVNRAKTRTICDSEILKNLSPKDIRGAVIVKECALESGQWRNWPSARILRKYMKRQVFPIIRTIITLAQQRNICESYVFVVVVGCVPAILYNLIVMWPLGLAFMLTSKVCIEDEYETIAFSSLFLLLFFKESVSD